MLFCLYVKPTRNKVFFFILHDNWLTQSHLGRYKMTDIPIQISLSLSPRFQMMTKIWTDAYTYASLSLNCSTIITPMSHGWVHDKYTDWPILKVFIWVKSLKLFPVEQVSIGSGNGLVLLGNRPLPEPMLTQLYGHHMASLCHNELTCVK